MIREEKEKIQRQKETDLLQRQKDLDKALDDQKKKLDSLEKKLKAQSQEPQLQKTQPAHEAAAPASKQESPQQKLQNIATYLSKRQFEHEIEQLEKGSQRNDLAAGSVEVMREKQRLDDLKDEEFAKRNHTKTTSFKKHMKSVEPQISLSTDHAAAESNKTK